MLEDIGGRVNDEASKVGKKALAKSFGDDSNDNTYSAGSNC
jgi:hypothetical protein